MELLILTAAGALTLLLIFANPYWGLLIYLGFIYLRPADLYPSLAPYHVTRVIAVLLIVSYFLRAGPSRKVMQPVPRQTLLYLGWLTLIFLSAIPGWWPYSINYFYEMLKIFIAYYLIVKLADSESRLRGLAWALLLLNAFLCFEAVLRYVELSGEVRIGGFAGAYFGNAGDFAAMINLMVPIAFMLLWAEKKFLPRIAALASLTLIVGAIVATQARSAGMISLVVILGILVFFGRRSSIKNLRSRSIGLCILIFLVIILFGSKAFWNRISTSLDVSQENAVHRIELVKAGARMFIHNPVLGIGAGMFQDRVLEFSNFSELKGYHPHNIFVLAAAELGIGGIICLVLLIYYSIRDSRLSYKNLSKRNPYSWSCSFALGLLVAVLAFPIVGMFQVILYYPPPYFLIGLAVAQKRLIEREEVPIEERAVLTYPHYGRLKPSVSSGRLAHRLGAIHQQKTS